MDGAPLANKSIVFTPAQGRAAMAVTDENGHYELIQVGGEPGAVIGNNAVSISTPLEAPPGPTYKDPIPARYNEATTLSADVKAGTENHFNFDLQSK